MRILFWQNLTNYQQTRYKITFLYFIIIVVIVGAFSFALITNQANQFERFTEIKQILIKDPQPRICIPQIYDEDRYNRIQNVVSQVRSNFIISTAFLDGIVVIFAALMSYYLSGKTLEPIIEALENQKRFTADASHELRTPLSVIKTEAEVMLRSKATTIEEYIEFSKSVVEEVNKLTQLTTYLLNIAKSDQRSQLLNYVSIDINELLSKLVEKLTDLATEKNIQLIYQPEKLNTIISDKGRLESICYIILDNAIKYNQQNGKVKITATQFPEYTTIEFADTGIGIAPDKLVKIFERFYRVSEDRNIKGFGLGLSLAKSMAQDIGAKINITSQLGLGTKINIIISKHSQ